MVCAQQLVCMHVLHAAVANTRPDLCKLHVPSSCCDVFGVFVDCVGAGPGSSPPGAGPSSPPSRLLGTGELHAKTISAAAPAVETTNACFELRHPRAMPADQARRMPWSARVPPVRFQRRARLAPSRGGSRLHQMRPASLV
jgi:hypothetical protein